MKLAEDLRRAVLQAGIEGKLTGGSREGWRFVRLGDVVNVVSARRVHQSDWQKSGIPFYRAREIARLSENGYVDNELYISEELFEKYSHSGMPSEGDIMITAVGTLGKTYVVKKGDKFYYKDASVLCLEKSDAVDSKYLDYVIKSELFMNQVRKNSSGTTVATLTIVRMNEYIIPLPPIDEQRRIVSRLDAILRLIAELESIENELEALERRFPGDMRDSLLQAAIEGRLTASNTDNWRYVRLGDVVHVISGTSYEKHDVCGEGIRIIRGGNLVGEKILLKDDDVFLPNQYANQEKQVQQNDIVIVASTGSLKGIGRAAFIDSKFDEPIQIGAFLRIIRPVDSSFADYLKVIFAGRYYRNHISSVVNGIGIKNIREKHITEFPIPLPPINEQHKIVARLNELLPLCEALEKIT